MTLKDNTVYAVLMFCWNVVDPATFPASNSVLGPYESENSLFIYITENTHYRVSEFLKFKFLQSAPLTIYLERHKLPLIMDVQKTETKSVAHNVLLASYPRWLCEEWSCSSAPFVVFSVTNQLIRLYNVLPDYSGTCTPCVDRSLFMRERELQFITTSVLLPSV